MKQKFPLDKILVKPQPRKTFEGIDSLAESIKLHGLLQPIVIDPSGRLLYGERRYRACKLLGLTEVDVVFSDEAPEDEIAERQLIENIEREALTWQEECLGILDIFRKKQLRGTLEGWSWGERQCAAMFNMALGTVNYVLKVARELEKELSLDPASRKLWSFSSVSEAYRLGILQQEEDRILAILAQKAKARAEQRQQDIKKETDAIIEEVTQVVVPPNAPTEQLLRLSALRERAKGNYLDLSKDEAHELYRSNPLNPPDAFDNYYAEKRSKLEDLLTVDLSSTILHTDSIDFMLANPGRFDHIITDPPYAIEMKNLSQDVGALPVHTERVADAHDVEENKSLLARFFPAAFSCTKEKAFVCVCCDVMLWQYMFELATKAGFAVQRWPVIWRKLSPCQNGAAQYNTTKNFELVMICRKPTAVLADKKSTSVVDASANEVQKIFGHPFSKPFELTQYLCEATSIAEQEILEPFAGGGSMVVGMLNLNRRVVAVEKELHHYNSLLENVKREYYLKLNPRTLFK